MSRRFGRNQRRKMREALEASNQQAHGALRALQLEEQLRQHTAYKLSEARALFERVSAALQEHSALLPAKTMRGLDVPSDRPVRYGSKASGRQLANGGGASVMDLYHITLEVERDACRFANHIHLNIAGNEPHRFAYAVSEKALLGLGMPDEQINKMAKHIAVELARCVNNRYRR